MKKGHEKTNGGGVTYAEFSSANVEELT